MVKSRVVDPAFSWGDDRSPDIPWHEMVVYELHVRGFTLNHPEVPPPLRGTYAGLATAPVIDHLKYLGVTSVELMPSHSFIDDRHLVDQGKRNYWGYNSIGFFAPDLRYAASGSIKEFKTMVKSLHSAGIEVIIDVVYNHTAEGNNLGPTFCFKGIDNSIYYRLVQDNPRFYMDYTGCGNTLNLRHPRVLQLIMDSLRYWVEEMHVDGFRFDLAAALAREQHAVDQLGAFFDILHQDPILSRVKLIAEPWDLGEGGYQVGNFPLGWAEWNDRYRDCMRGFWRGDGGKIGEFATRLTGSSDLYAHNGRKPYASVNYITCHDGFTLHDLVSYNDKHNEANGEENRDGSNNNLSWNCGVEGKTADAKINSLRARQKRNLLATLLFSQGVPMLLAGDELGRSQQGNNNAYCQDSEIGWVSWSLTDDDRDMLDFVRRIITLRREHPVFHRRNFFQGRSIRGSGIKDIHWIKPDGTEMSDEEWAHDFARSLGVYLSGEALGEVDARGRPVRDDNFLILFNAHHERIDFRLPELCGSCRRHCPSSAACQWQAELDTHYHAGLDSDGRFKSGDLYPLEGRTLALLRQMYPASSTERETS
jgi:glycogen operon protein